MPPITIEALTLKGDGRAEGIDPIPRVLPGEVVSDDGKILTPSAHRVSPPCRHFRTCGACALQHASDDWVAEWKTDVIAQGLAAHGIDAELRPIQTSPPAARRRASLHGRRTKKGALVGFKSRGTDTLISIPDCRVLAPELIEALPFLESLTRQFASRKGELDFALTLCDTGLDLDIRGVRELTSGEIEAVASQTAQHKIARLSLQGNPIAIHAAPRQMFGDVAVIPPPGAFLQATHLGEEAIWNSVREGLGGATRIADLFAGCGTFALRAAQLTPVDAFEGEAELIAAMELATRQAIRLKALKPHVRDLFRRPLLPEELNRFDAIIIDPPRAGARAQTVEIAGSSVGRVCAVSCNPVSFARDAAVLIGSGFRLDWVQPVDQFRWSAHVELAAQFTR